MADLQVHPDRSTFDRAAADWPLVPVWTELLADIGTPVGLFPAIAGDGPGLLLGSVSRHGVSRLGKRCAPPCTG
jgi:hypothetical protein